MLNRVSKRTQWGIMVLILVCAIITLVLRIFLNNELAAYESSPEPAHVAQETEEQLIVTDMEETAVEETVDLLTRYNAQFEEIDSLYDEISGMQQGSELKANYQKIADLWDRELKSLESDISSGMTEDDKKTYFDSENTFLVSRNHECMKVVDQNKVSVMEGIDYLDRYIELTREHCIDLVKDYTSYLAS